MKDFIEELERREKMAERKICEAKEYLSSLFKEKGWDPSSLEFKVFYYDSSESGDYFRVFIEVRPKGYSYKGHWKGEEAPGVLLEFKNGKRLWKKK